MNENDPDYQALLVVSFGGPEGPDDVMPFLRNVLRGKNVPQERMLEVAEHYYQFDGVSPINRQNRELIAALEDEFRCHNLRLPIYFGNRNWHPMIEDALRNMREDGVRQALAFFTSAFSCYSGCRQYREDIYQAQQRIGGDAPQIHKLRMFFNHPLFIEAAADRVRDALSELESVEDGDLVLLFSAHSIPQGMAENCVYEMQLLECCRLVAKDVGITNWQLVFQSRSGPPHQPWLEPDVCDYLGNVGQRGVGNVIIMPIGFISDHIEILFDLDVEARETCDRLGIKLARAHSVGTHPRFISMIRELVEERIQDKPRAVVGDLPASPDVCPPDCCQSGRPGSISPV